MAISKIQSTFAHDVSKLISFIFWKGYTCTLGEAFRTKEQAEINVKNHTGILDSQHCKRLAIDLNLFSPEGEYLTKTSDYEQFGKYWEFINSRNNWGGNFLHPDGNHFEAKE